MTVLEATYEDSEDSALERQFAIANTTMARLRLASGDLEDAVDYYESAMGMLPEAEGSLLRAQCQFGTGIAKFRLGQVQESIGAFEGALESAGEDLHVRGHVTVMLAQSLWSMGTEDAQESAKAQLLDCITADPENLTAISTLAGMGILTEDDSLVDAALSEILSLPPDRRRARDPGRDVTYLLMQQHLEQNDIGRAKAEAQRAVFAEPADAGARHSFATLIRQSGNPAASLAVLATSAQRGSEDGSKNSIDEQRLMLALRAVVEADIGDNNALRTAQRAVGLSPWDRRAWASLAYVRNKMYDGGGNGT